MRWKAVELIGDVDEQHRLHAEVPADIPAGKVPLIVFRPEEDVAGNRQADGMAWQCWAELADPREDIYTLADGQPVGKQCRRCLPP